MRKRLLLLFAILAMAINASAYDFEVDGIYYDILSQNDLTCEVTNTSGNKYSGDIVIPSTVTYSEKTYSVTSIGNYAFSNCSSLTSVTIPNSVTSIGSRAFYWCSSLTSVEIPNSVTSVGDWAFQNCFSLTSFTGKLASEDNRCLIIDGVLISFARAGLTSYTIPNSVTSIGEYAFYNCSSLTSVEVPNSVTSIGAQAFERCSSLTSVEIPNSVTSIGECAFFHCSSLTSVKIPNSVTSIGWSVFSNCSSLTSVVIPNSVTSIDGAFSGCTSLTSVVIPNSVTSIGDSAFSGCTSLTSVEIPNSVTSIGEYAFSSCTSLTSVEIGNSVIWIGRTAFGSCYNLTSVEIPNSVTSIGDGAFYECSSLTSVVIGNSVTTIGYEAFRDCSSLTSVEIPNSVTSIGNNAFCACSSLTSVEIPNSVTSIGKAAFLRCSSLTSFTGKYASDDHRSLIVDGVLNSFAPAGLTSYVIPNSVTSIGLEVFCFCTGLTSVEIPNSVTSIGNNVFYYCSSLTSVTVENTNPANITVGDYVFLNVPTSTCTLHVPKGCKELYAAAKPWNSFGAIEELGTVYTLADGETYAGNINLNNIDITYTRTFSSTDWQPLYLPFNMSYEEWSEYGTVAELACVHTYEDGKTIIEFVTVNSGELQPNVPYVIKPNVTGEVTFNCTGKQLKAAPAEGEKYIVCCSPRYIFKLFGNYRTLSAGTLAGYGDAQFNGAYVMTAGNKFSHAAEGSQLKPYRFYITKEKNPNGYWSAPARYNMPAATGDDADVIYFMVDGKVTGILSASEDNANDVKVYDLNGIQTRDPHNGFFIKNGKKVYIK